MVRETTITLTANGHGVQPYIGRDLLEDTACPLSQGQTVAARVIEGVGILLVPEHDAREFSVEATDPDLPDVDATDGIETDGSGPDRGAE